MGLRLWLALLLGVVGGAAASAQELAFGGETWRGHGLQVKDVPPACRVFSLARRPVEASRMRDWPTCAPACLFAGRDQKIEHGSFPGHVLKPADAMQTSSATRAVEA